MTQADLEAIRKAQLDPATHKVYYRLRVKETGEALCTLCAHSRASGGHNHYYVCPNKALLQPYRRTAENKEKEPNLTGHNRPRGNEEGP